MFLSQILSSDHSQSRSQKPGLGFPIVRILVVISLAVGTVLDAAMGPYRAKETSELGCSARSVALSDPATLPWPTDCSVLTGS